MSLIMFLYLTTVPEEAVIQTERFYIPVYRVRTSYLSCKQLVFQKTIQKEKDLSFDMKLESNFAYNALTVGIWHIQT